MNEQELYKEMCSACPKSKQCHDDATMCDEYARMVNKIVGLPPFKPSEKEILAWLNDYKDYYNLNVLVVSLNDREFELRGFKDGKTEKLYREEINND